MALSKHFSEQHAGDLKRLSTGFSFKLFVKGLLKRSAFVTTEAMAMSTAWCILFGLQWQHVRWYPQLGAPETITFRVVLALANSSIAFCITLVLDKIADAQISDDEAVEDMLDMAVIKIISALSISVGFSWEQAFEGAIEVVSARMPTPTIIPMLKDRAVMELLVTTVITGVVAYAWRMYILLKLHKLEILHSEKKSDPTPDQEMHDMARELMVESASEVEPRMPSRGMKPKSAPRRGRLGYNTAWMVAAPAAIQQYTDVDGSAVRRWR